MKYIASKRKVRYPLIILTVILAVTAVCSMGGVLFALKLGAYEENLDTLLENAQNNLQGTYSKIIYDEIIGEYIYDSAYLEDFSGDLSDSGMEYAVLKGYSLEDAAWVYQTEGFVISDDLEDSTYQECFYPWTECYYRLALIGSIFDSGHQYSQWEEILDYQASELSGREISDTAAEIVYNKDDGVFYYEGESGLSYPVTELKVSGKDLIAAGDIPDSAKYKTKKILFYLQEENGQKKYTSASIDGVSDGKYTLSTDQYRQWSYIYQSCIDDTLGYGTLAVETEKIASVSDSTLFPRIQGVNENGVWWISDHVYSESSPAYVLPVFSFQSSDVAAVEKYWVVSYVPDTENKGVSNLFTQQESLISFVYHMRYLFILIGFIAAACACVLLVLCCFGRYQQTRNDHKKLVLWHRIPLAVHVVWLVSGMYLCMVCIYHLFGLIITESSASAVKLFFAMLPVFLAAAVLLAVWFCLELVCRYGAGVLSKNTLCGWLLRKCKWVGRLLRENLSITVKVIGFLAILGIVQLFVILVTNSRDDLEVSAFLLYKAAESVFILWVVLQLRRLQKQAENMAAGDLDSKIDTKGLLWDLKRHGENLNQLSDGMVRAVDARMKSERFKTELITNVSHDIKTPLTSIINYVDLLKKEQLGNEKAQEYLEVLDRQSLRMKKLIEDLMDASKASTGNLTVEKELCDVNILLTQTLGEFEERLQQKDLKLIINKEESPIYLFVDNRYLWRIFDNLMNNICKYGQSGTRVYINIEKNQEKADIIFRNTSKYPLNISSEELMERFVRGDASRNTEGSGLGLSIAQDLCRLMDGSMKLYVDGDLFKVVLTFPQFQE